MRQTMSHIGLGALWAKTSNVNMLWELCVDGRPAAMAIAEENPVAPRDEFTTVYPVEVSGWDHGERFFVERTALEWGLENGKSVLVRHALRRGSVVFVRLIDQGSLRDTFPVAYRIADASHPDQRGLHTVKLELLASRENKEVWEQASASN